MEVYLDNAATTRVCPEAADIAYKVMTECYGNPSSTHTKGREAKTYLDTARSQIAAALGCSASEVYFTSCGSESDVWAITKGAESMSRRGKHIISSAVEHDAVRKTLEDLGARGFEVTYLAPEKDGAISVESVKNALREDTILVTLMMVNNETGGITDIAGIAKMLKAEGSKALLHTDAVQGFMKVPFSAKKLGADMISISGHKIHAPKGIGALYIKTGVKIKPLIRGGAQESGMRAGTEAMPQIAAFGKAAEIAFAGMQDNWEKMARLRALAADRLCADIPEALMRSAIRNLRAAIQNPQDYTARSNLMWAATLAQRGDNELSRSRKHLCFKKLGLQKGRAQSCARGYAPPGAGNRRRDQDKLFAIQHRGRRSCPVLGAKARARYSCAQINSKFQGCT